MAFINLGWFAVYAGDITDCWGNILSCNWHWWWGCWIALAVWVYMYMGGIKSVALSKEKMKNCLYFKSMYFVCIVLMYDYFSSDSGLSTYSTLTACLRSMTTLRCWNVWAWPVVWRWASAPQKTWRLPAVWCQRPWSLMSQVRAREACWKVTPPDGSE